jgi:hypothetical protein
MRRILFAPLCVLGFTVLSFVAWEISAFVWSTVLALLAFFSLAYFAEPKSVPGQIGMFAVSTVAVACVIGLLDVFFDDGC